MSAAFGKNAPKTYFKNVPVAAPAYNSESILMDQSNMELLNMHTVVDELDESLPLPPLTYRKQPNNENLSNSPRVNDYTERTPAGQTERSLIKESEDDGFFFADEKAVFGKDAEMFQTTFLSTVMTAANYVSADITKK